MGVSFDTRILGQTVLGCGRKGRTIWLPSSLLHSPEEVGDVESDDTA
jgi:hypothetical protein